MAEGLQLQAVRDEAARAEETNGVRATENDELAGLGDRNSDHSEEVATAATRRSTKETSDVGVSGGTIGNDECIYNLN